MRDYGQFYIPFYQSYREVPEDEPFRYPDDIGNIIRIKQQYEISAPEKWDIVDEERDLAVAGVSYRIDSVMRFMAGQCRRVNLAHEPLPKYPHAIAVYGNWLGENGNNCREQLGYLPNDFAKEMRKKISKQKDYLLLGKLSTMFFPTEEKPSPGLRIDVALFQPALPRFELRGIDKNTGRKRKHTYIAKNEENAIMQAQKDGIIVEMDTVKKIPR